MPQGCVLSPILFCLYIKHLLVDLDPSLFVQGYADDLIFGSRSGPGSVNKLQKCLNIIYERACLLGVQFDIGVKKSAAMWITLNKNVRKPCKPLLKLGGKFIPWTDLYKYLGILLDNRLTMKAEVTKRLKEGVKRNLLVFRLRTCTKRTLRSLWIGYCRSAVVYGLKHYYFHLSKTLQDKIAAYFTVSAKKIVGLPVWSNNAVSLQLAAIDPLHVFIQNSSAGSVNRTVLRRLKTRTIGLHLRKSCQDARQIELNYARWTSGFLYTNQVKNKFDKYRRIEGSYCRFGYQEEETREHLLLECVHLDNSRQELFQGIQGVLGVLPTNLQEALGMRVRSHARKGKIARFLYEFLCKSNLHM